MSKRPEDACSMGLSRQLGAIAGAYGIRNRHSRNGAQPRKPRQMHMASAYIWLRFVPVTRGGKNRLPR